MKSTNRCSIVAMAAILLASWPMAGKCAPGDPDALFGTNGKAVVTDPSDTTKAAGRICALAKSKDVDTSYAVAVDFFKTLAQGQFGGFLARLNGSNNLDYLRLHDQAGDNSFFGCAGAAGGSSPTGTRVPTAPVDYYYAVGSIAGEAGFVKYDPGLDMFTDIPLDLSSSGNDRLLGVAPFGAGTFVVAGEVNSVAEAALVDLSGATPAVSSVVTVNVGAPDNVFYDVALSRDGTAAYIVGRGSIYEVVCKVAYPSGTPVTEFGGTGCLGSDLGGQAAEAHQVVPLNNGDIAITGWVYLSGISRMFIIALDGMTGAADPAFDGDGKWIEAIDGSTQSQGWGLAAMDFGFAAVGWVDVSGQREMMMPVFDGLQADTRYPNGGIVLEAIGTEGHAISVARVSQPPPPPSLQPAAVPQDFDFAVAGDEDNGAQAFVIQFQGMEPDSLFGNGFE